jgi:imidazoleglycerol phosphate synthase glutamine amidotransferase subunit HisH
MTVQPAMSAGPTLLEMAPDCLIPGVGAAQMAMKHCVDQQLERLPDGI